MRFSSLPSVIVPRPAATRALRRPGSPPSFCVWPPWGRRVFWSLDAQPVRHRHINRCQQQVANSSYSRQRKRRQDFTGRLVGRTRPAARSALAGFPEAPAPLRCPSEPGASSFWSSGLSVKTDAPSPWGEGDGVPSCRRIQRTAAGSDGGANAHSKPRVAPDVSSGVHCIDVVVACLPTAPMLAGSPSGVLSGTLKTCPGQMRSGSLICASLAR